MPVQHIPAVAKPTLQASWMQGFDSAYPDEFMRIIDN